MNKMTVENVEVNSKKVVVRVDFNVPVNKGQVTNDKRIRAALPTIEYLTGQGARVILISHLGRPKGEFRPEMSLKPCAAVLEKMLGRPVQFVENCVGEIAEQAVETMQDGQVILLENLRFHDGETKNDSEFAASLAGLGQLYVNDAFGTAHRAHASTVGICQYIQPCVAGYLMQKEIQYLGNVVQNAERPFVAIIGGAKISGKMDVMANLLGKVDNLLIGGAMAFTFLKARSINVGRSMIEEDKISLAARLIESWPEKIALPVDCVVTDKLDPAEQVLGALETVRVEAIGPSQIGVDIGPETIALFSGILEGARTVVWNGPMGVFEIDAAAEGTMAVARMLADITGRGAVTVIGGGDSAAAAEKAKVADRLSHVSTGGGASLAFLEGKRLPAIEALTDLGT